MNKKQAVQVLLKRSLLFSDCQKKAISDRLEVMSEAEVTSLGKILAKERKMTVRVNTGLLAELKRMEELLK